MACPEMCEEETNVNQCDQCAIGKWSDGGDCHGGACEGMSGYDCKRETAHVPLD